MRNLKKFFACLMIVSFLAIANVQFVYAEFCGIKTCLSSEICCNGVCVPSSTICPNPLLPPSGGGGGGVSCAGTLCKPPKTCCPPSLTGGAYSCELNCKSTF